MCRIYALQISKDGKKIKEAVKLSTALPPIHTQKKYTYTQH